MSWEGEGRREYIRMERDLEQMIRWEAEGVTVVGLEMIWGEAGLNVRVNVEISSPS
jgi:hypothetical protein